MRRRRTGPKKQFLKYVAGYLSIFCLTKLIFILTSNSLVLMIWGDFDMINTHFYDAVLYLNALMTTFSEPAVFLSILYELYTLAGLRRTKLLQSFAKTLLIPGMNSKKRTVSNFLSKIEGTSVKCVC
jgi:hypothetical protein